MGLKKIARPINKAKNVFLQWLKDNNATDIDIFEGGASVEWDYYRHISAFIGESQYNVYFMMWNGVVEIKYSDEENSYDKLDIEEFLQLIN